MRQVYINQYEKVISQDMNNMQLGQAKSLQDDFAYNFFGLPSGGVLGSSFICSYISAFAASLSAGAGFFYDSTQTGLNPNLRLIISSGVIPVAITANANATYNRIDLICLAPNYAVTSTASRFLKTGGVGPVTSTTVNKTYSDGYTLQVVAGTASASPVAPSVPAGYIAISQILNLANSVGMSGSGAITDQRTILSISASNLNHNIATGTSVQTQLDQIDNALTKTRTVTTGIQILSTDCMIRSNSTSGLVTQTLPQCTATPIGKEITIKDVGNGTYNTQIAGFAGVDLVDGYGIYQTNLNQYDAITVKNNGTSWDVI